MISENEIMKFVNWNHVHSKTYISFSVSLNTCHCLGMIKMMNY